MEGDEDERAEAEMAALTFYHRRHLEQKEKFVKRIPSMLFKVLLVAMAVALLPSLPAQFSVLINYFRRALLTRTREIVNLILVGLVVSYGVLSRGRPRFVEPDRESDGSDSYVAKLFEFGGTFADYVDPGESDRSTAGKEANVGGGEHSDPVGGEERNAIDGQSPRRATESPLKLPGPSLRNSVSYPDLTELVDGETSDRRRASDDMDLWGKNYARTSDGPASGSNGSDAAYGRPYPSSGAGTGKSEVNFGRPLVSDKNLSVDKAKRRHSAPPPLPAPGISVENRLTQKDSNPGPRPERPERKPPILPPPPPPRLPPPPLLAVETHLPPQVYCSENVVQIVPRTENLERREKTEKTEKLGKSAKSEKKVPSPPPLPPPAPPTALESGLPPKHESKHRRSKSKEDSKHRSKDESKHRSAGKEIANALGLFSQSETKQAKIPSPPAPPPLPSALQQWFSSYRRESKHRSKDSEPSPRLRSERASRKVHSSSSPPSPPPLPPPPRLPPVYTVDGVSASKFSSKRTRDGASASKDSSKPRRDETSGSKVSSRTTRDGASGSKESSEPRMDETPGSKDSSKAAGGGTSAIRDSSKPRKEGMVGTVPDVKAGEKVARRKSTSIPLPPPPPPPFAIGEEHWPLYDRSKHQKRSSSPVVLWEESAASEPEPEHDPEPVIRRHVSLDSTELQFCPSPSPDEVNKKADAFIARFHEQIRLQRMNSIRERLDRGSR